MKYLVTLNYQTFLLPSEKGVATILSAFAGAVVVDDNRYREGGIEIQREVEITASPVSPNVRITAKPEASQKIAAKRLLPLMGAQKLLTGGAS